jgi:hypothetical protein
MMESVGMDQLSSVEILVRHGAEIDRPNRFGRSPIRLASELRDAKLLAILTDKGDSP